MNRSRYLPLGALLCAAAIPAPALADTTDGARVGGAIELQRSPVLSYSEYAGPVSIGLTNRSGSVRATADYGSLKVFGTQRMSSIVDGRSSSTTSTVLAQFGDRFDISHDWGQMILDFHVDFADPIGAVTARGNRGVEATFGSNFGVLMVKGDFSGSTSWNWQRTTVDTPTRSPVTTYESSANGTSLFSFLPTITAVDGGPAGYSRFRLSGMFSAGTWQIFGVSSCYLEMVSFRIGDTASGSCNSNMRWGGLAGARFGSSGVPAPVDFASFSRGVSGYDWSQPYAMAGDGGRRVAALSSIAAVPEPATWAMLILGFGLVGWAARRRTRGAAVAC